MLDGKNILLGVTGSIAAYKAAVLVRALVREGAQVKVVMTDLAKQFITPLTMATLAKNPVLVEFFDPENGTWNSHVSLGEWADAYVIAPATANSLGKMAHGIADNLLLTTYLSARCPVLVAPAMDLDMFTHSATRQNLEKLRRDGVAIIEPGCGELASGLSGKGRMAEPEEIVEALAASLCADKKFAGRKVLVTAGPTVEEIDPVRFISNYSSGKMGYAIARSMLLRGADVTLVTGPTALEVPRGVKAVKVDSAGQMYDACRQHFPDCDIAVLCAAVADYTPAQRSDTKLKKLDDQEQMSVTLRKTPDIAAELGADKGNRLTVGFALETDNEKENALRKLERKNLDMIVLNSLRDDGAGFAGDTNKFTIFTSDGASTEYPLMSKAHAAEVITDSIAKII